jgi:hypothetical protein
MRLWRGSARAGLREMVGALAAGGDGPERTIPKTKLKIVEKSRRFLVLLARVFHIPK